ncbi:MAG: ionic transporter y4hA [Comamonadaceae bacterium]|jgi:Ca2+:H+ antiporter|nr:ionic transporter y4hA [Comamonadaceae bacterium]HPL80714.1 ionic transporter y4hA [Burkholderiaceae bacterium]
MKKMSFIPAWTLAAPIAGWLILAGSLLGTGGWYALLMTIGLFASVLAAVHHAEVVAHRVGEPFGTLILALAVTVIEVALIVSLMLAGGASTGALARDTVFAAVMLILNGIVGLCLLVGGSRHREQSFGQHGVSASLATLAAIAVLTLVLPNFTTSLPGPVYNPSQLAFIAVISLVLYGTFALVQTVRHRDYFLPAEAATDATAHAERPGPGATALAGGLLLACLAAVVLLGKALSPSIEAAVAAAGAPKALVGIIIAAVVLLPEALAALRAARANRLQTSLNLAIGSALASIGLTIPAVAIVALATGWTLTLGIDPKSTVLLLLSLMVATLSLGTGRTTVLQGVVHLVIFAVYLFTTIVP